MSGEDLDSVVRPHVKAMWGVGLETVDPNPFLSFSLFSGPGVLAVQNCCGEVLEAVFQEVGH